MIENGMIVLHPLELFFMLLITFIGALIIGYAIRDHQK